MQSNLAPLSDPHFMIRINLGTAINFKCREIVQLLPVNIFHRNPSIIRLSRDGSRKTLIRRIPNPRSRTLAAVTSTNWQQPPAIWGHSEFEGDPKNLGWVGADI